MRQSSAVPDRELPSPQQGAIEPVYTRDELITRTDWDETTTRLLGYARAKVWRYGADAARFTLQPSDLVQEAVTAWLEGRRAFEAGTEGAFFGFLCGTIDSLTSHQKEKSIRRGWQYSISKEGGDDATSGEITEERIQAGGDFEHDLLFRDNVERFIESLEPDLAAYAMFVAGVPDLSAEQRALALGTTVTDVRNFDRRLHRRARQWMKR